MGAAAELGLLVGIAAACAALGVARASFYRAHRSAGPKVAASHTRPVAARALDAGERAAVIEVLHEQRFADSSVREVYAALLDEGRYLCSIATMYRLLRALGESRERRAQRQHPRYTMPRLVAAAPNQVWSWDITKLGGPAQWLYFSLYVVLDIFSRYVIGWLVAERESHELAGRLLTQSMAKQGVTPGTLTVHSDRGAPMKAKPQAQLFADLGVIRSLSRPRVSNDNPFSESHFKTLKYCPAFPQRFASPQDARAFCRQFFTGTTRSIITPDLGCWPLTASITAWPMRFSPRVRLYLRAPARPIRNVSSVASRRSFDRLQRSGSTRWPPPPWRSLAPLIAEPSCLNSVDTFRTV